MSGRELPSEAHPVVLALVGTLFTWGVTAFGAAFVFVLDIFPMTRSAEKVLLDVSLGFSAGVMLAASVSSVSYSSQTKVCRPQSYVAICSTGASLLLRLTRLRTMDMATGASYLRL